MDFYYILILCIYLHWDSPHIKWVKRAMWLWDKVIRRNSRHNSNNIRVGALKCNFWWVRIKRTLQFNNLGSKFQEKFDAFSRIRYPVIIHIMWQLQIYSSNWHYIIYPLLNLPLQGFTILYLFTPINYHGLPSVNKATYIWIN